jgi:hypothetical protein
MKISGSTKLSSRRSQDSQVLRSNSSPIKIAIAFQKFWHFIGYIVQGLLGGIALLHFILVSIYNIISRNDTLRILQYFFFLL